VSMSTNRGQQLIGKEVGGCLLEQLIGYGGSSAVFLAQPLDAREKVAVKVFLPHTPMDSATQKSFYRRFLREAQAASELDHPNILSIYSYGEHEGLPYIVMPYIPGGTLSEYVKKYGPLTLREAQNCIEQIADALAYAHKKGVIHCDVKPANILLDKDGRVVLSDFGIVRFTQRMKSNAQPSLKSPEALMGTPEYVSPEQALGEPLDERSDVYSLAVTLFYLLTGLPPFRSESPITLLLMQVHEAPPRLSSARADVTPLIDSVLDKALAKSPADRYQTAEEFSQAWSGAVAAAEETHNIDWVVLTPSATKMLAESRKNFEEAPQPLVEIRPVTRKTSHFSRSMAIALVLGIVLIGSVTVAALFFYTARPPRSTAITPTATPAITDSLMDQANWPINNYDKIFFFLDNKYHILNPPSSGSIAVALYANHIYTNFHLTVTAQEITPSANNIDFYGVVLRAAPNYSHYYLFEISPDYNGGWYYFARYDGKSSPTYLTNGPAPSVKKQGQDNTISIVAVHNTFTFSVNGVQVGSYTDSSHDVYTSGEIGLCVEDPDEEVVFSGLYFTNS
jgi:serine/threonine protein kinase